MSEYSDYLNSEAGQADRAREEASLAAAKAGRPSLTIRDLRKASVARTQRWHSARGGLNSWSALEWAGAMAGEAGEACNAAKKLKRLEDQIASINLEYGRSVQDLETARTLIVREIADTILYGVLLAERIDRDLEAAIVEVFNRKSEEYGFPERL